MFIWRTLDFSFERRVSIIASLGFWVSFGIEREKDVNHQTLKLNLVSTGERRKLGDEHVRVEFWKLEV